MLNKRAIFLFEIVAFNCNFAKVLVNRRLALGWSETYLADEMGVEVEYIQAIENNAENCTMGEYVVVCRALGLDAALAIMEVEEMPDPEDQYIEAQLKKSVNEGLLKHRQAQ